MPEELPGHDRFDGKPSLSRVDPEQAWQVEHGTNKAFCKSLMVALKTVFDREPSAPFRFAACGTVLAPTGEKSGRKVSSADGRCIRNRSPGEWSAGENAGSLTVAGGPWWVTSSLDSRVPTLEHFAAKWIRFAIGNAAHNKAES